MKKLLCATLDGLDAKVVDVEVEFVRALPSFSIVGLAQASIQESKERVKSALNSIEFKFPPQKVTVNLAPSDLKKEGSHFDLPIALLIALQKEQFALDSFMAFGELSLDGTLKDTASIFAIILSLAKQGLVKKVIIPKASYDKVSKIPSLDIYAYDHIKEIVESLKNPDNLKSSKSDLIIDAKSIKIKDTYYYIDQFKEDFIDIKGQTIAKRASLIAAAGMHNIIFEGSPGCGKSMCAKRIRYILPPMSLEEILSSAKLDSLSGKEPDFKPIRPFRSPHHTSSRSSIFGGGSKRAMIGEIALADGGELFFDELVHFPKSILEALREPLEDHKMLISRVNSKIQYQTKFLFCGAFNPCPCGNLLSSKKVCRCSELEIKRYQNRLSSPLLDRIDLYVLMDEIGVDDKPTISSKEMYQKVLKAFKMQKSRNQSDLNGKMSDSDIKKYCKLDRESQATLDQAISRFDLSQRAINKTLKVARTIADLDESDNISKSHILEALTYRVKR